MKFRRYYEVDPNGSSRGGAGTEDGGTGAGATPEWVNSLPEEARTDPNIIKYKTPEDFYKGYKSTVELVGRKGVIIPTDKSTPEEWEKYYNSTGRPEKPEGYKFSKIEGLHKDVSITPEFDGGLATVFHKAGLNNAQSEGLRKEFVGLLNQAQVDQEKRENQAIQTAETALRKEWGANYDANKNLVAKGIMKAGGQEALDAMGGEKGLGNNPVVLKALAKVFSSMSEDQLKAFDGGAGGSGGQAGNETPEVALQKINSMMADTKHPINNANDPKHSEAVEERMRLYKRAYPNESGV